MSWRNRGTGDLTTHVSRTSFPASVFWRLGAALRCQRGGNDRLVRVHVGDGRDADARRLDDVDGMDADSFLGMWIMMMVAMMLPSLVPMLWRYRQAVGRPGETRLGRLTALVGVGYFFVWTVFGMAAFPLGVALAAIEMQQPELARAVPIAVGVVVLIAGSLQLTAWKARHLAWCREAPGRGRTLPTDAVTAWRHGLRLGLHCSHCCFGLMAILLAIGVMDLRAMAFVAAAITVERLAPAGEPVARAIGAVVVVAGLFQIAASSRARMTHRIVPRSPLLRLAARQRVWRSQVAETAARRSFLLSKLLVSLSMPER